MSAWNELIAGMDIEVGDFYSDKHFTGNALASKLHIGGIADDHMLEDTSKRVIRAIEYVKGLTDDELIESQSAFHEELESHRAEFNRVIDRAIRQYDEHVASIQ